MKFYIETINDNGSGMEYNTKEEFLKELSLMIDDCIENGVTYFDANIDADASCFYNENLPTEVCAIPTDIDEEWNEMDEDDKEEAVSDFLSDTYGFCHKGFTYEEINGLIHITNIIWDEED